MSYVSNAECTGNVQYRATDSDQTSAVHARCARAAACRAVEWPRGPTSPRRARRGELCTSS
eukprot:3607388-Prymnesium_polylepis.2